MGDLNVPGPPSLPPMSDQSKKRNDAQVEPEEGHAVEEVEQEDKQPSRKSDSSQSSNRARTRARTNGQTGRSKKQMNPADIAEALEESSTRHGHPQLERTSASHRWPVWALEALRTKARIERRQIADLIAELCKDGLADDEVAEREYAKACQRVNAIENDWESGEANND